MRISLKTALALFLIPQILIVKALGKFPEIVEEYYSKGLYPYLSRFFRSLFGWIPFSVGDLLYVILGGIALIYLIRRLRKPVIKPFLFLRDLGFVLSVAYFTFHLLWGMNYYRIPLHQTLDIPTTYTRKDLLEVTRNLISETNHLQFELTGNDSTAVDFPYSQKEIREQTLIGYQSLAATHPDFRYKNPSLKNSLISTALTYMGYGGYLNPFTGEAQVNGLLPLFRYPVVCGHEVGHQLGYSAENETNFIGYWVTRTNPDPYFKYSASAYALSYCLFDIQRYNKTLYQALLKELHPGVLANYRELNIFWSSFENPLEPVFKEAFSSFLKFNNQPEGIYSYNRIVALVVGYHQREPILPRDPKF